MDLERSGPIDRTPGTPGSDKNGFISTCIDRKEIDMIIVDIIAVADIFVVLGLAAKLILWLFLLFSLQLFDVVYSYGSFSCC